MGLTLRQQLEIYIQSLRDWASMLEESKEQFKKIEQYEKCQHLNISSIECRRIIAELELLLINTI